MQLVDHGALIDTQAICGNYRWDLATDPLVQTAIASKKSQIALSHDPQTDPEQPCKTNLAIAITFREEVLGILAMRWRDANALSLDDVAVIQQCADEVALALICIRYHERL